jgi:hypothetical protein
VAELPPACTAATRPATFQWVECSMSGLRVVLAEDHFLVREGLVFSEHTGATGEKEQDNGPQ